MERSASRSLASGRLQRGFQVGHGIAADEFQIVAILQNLEDVRRDEGRRSRTDADASDVQRQQSQQNGHGLLFEPRQDDREGQVVDAAVESFRKGDGDLDGPVGVVALPHVEQARDGTRTVEVDGTEVVVPNAEFSATQGEDERVVRRVRSEIRVVVAARFRAVTATDEKDVAQLAGLDGRQDFLAEAENRGMMEADGGRRGGIVRQGLALPRAFDQLGEVVGGETPTTRNSGDAVREEPVLIALTRDQDAVGGCEDGA